MLNHHWSLIQRRQYWEKNLDVNNSELKSDSEALNISDWEEL